MFESTTLPGTNPFFFFVGVYVQVKVDLCVL